MGSFRIIGVGKSRRDASSTENWVRFAFFGCWRLAFGSWPCGIGFVSHNGGAAGTEIGFVLHNGGWGSRRDASGTENWVRFVFLGLASSGDWVRFAFFWLLAVGGWLLAVGLVELGSFRIFWLLAFGDWLLAG